MPINIYRDVEPSESLGHICPDDWELPSQILGLEAWLEDASATLTPGNIIADIGYSVRVGALGGGAVLAAESMKKFSDMGVTIFFSEYDVTTDDTKQECEQDAPSNGG